MIFTSSYLFLFCKPAPVKAGQGKNLKDVK